MAANHQHARSAGRAYDQSHSLSLSLSSEKYHQPGSLVFPSCFLFLDTYIRLTKKISFHGGQVAGTSNTLRSL